MHARIPSSVAQTLQQQILSGHYASGSTLPAQRELAQRLGISRASLREALSVLETLGLVDIQPGRGVMVRGTHAQGGDRAHRAFAAPEMGTLSPRQLIELRLVLEPGWTALAATRIDAAALQQLQRLQLLQSEALQRNDLLSAAETDLHFHLLLAQLSGNPGLVAMARQLEPAIAHSLRLPFARTGADDQPAREHEAILKALCAGDAAASAEAMRAHLLSAAQRGGIDMAAPPPPADAAVPAAFRLVPHPSFPSPAEGVFQ